MLASFWNLTVLGCDARLFTGFLGVWFWPLYSRRSRCSYSPARDWIFRSFVSGNLLYLYYQHEYFSPFNSSDDRSKLDLSFSHDWQVKLS